MSSGSPDANTNGEGQSGGPERECFGDNHHCYYVYKDAWHVWGRWLMLALLVAFVIAMIPISGYLMSITRMRKGLPPVPGCGWMFPNPYKKAQGPSEMDVESQTVTQPPRYRPNNMYQQYQLEQQRERMQREQEAYSTTDGEMGDSTTNYSELNEKPMHQQQ